MCTRTFVWGTDLSGSFQGAGGVGGLLTMEKAGHYFCPTYDANGNVSEYLGPRGYMAADHYEYDPFGRQTIGEGNFPFRFSTKYHDTETSLYYYGYRYYSPDLGRWLNRDPIGELGESTRHPRIRTRQQGLNSLFLSRSIEFDQKRGYYGSRKK